MTRIDWRARDEDVARIAAARHGDPFSVLGLHLIEGGAVVRAFVPGAERLEVLKDGQACLELERRNWDFFEGFFPGETSRFSYRLRASNLGGTWEFADPYGFGPVLGPMDDYLIVEGTHRQLYGRIGAHLITHEGVNGVLFSVWAPQASRVSVVGDLNQWDGRLHQMRKRVDSGLWELFAPGAGEGTNYKYEIVGPNGQLQPLKADPMGFGGEMRPSTASVVTRTSNFTWHDEAHMAARQGPAPGAGR